MAEYDEVLDECVDSAGELHMLPALRDGAEVWAKADGQVIRVHLGLLAVSRDIGQEREEDACNLLLDKNPPPHQFPHLNHKLFSRALT